jgi:rhodanese-related sulfurtransferase
MSAKETLEHGELDVLTPEEAKQLVDEGKAVIVDVRTPAEYAFERIRGAMLVPLSEFDGHAMPTQEQKRVILQCASGVRSKVAADRMLEAGAEQVAHIDGGIAAWKRARLPFIVTDPMTGAPRDIVSG